MEGEYSIRSNHPAAHDFRGGQHPDPSVARQLLLLRSETTWVVSYDRDDAHGVSRIHGVFMAKVRGLHLANAEIQKKESRGLDRERNNTRNYI